MESCPINVMRLVEYFEYPLLLMVKSLFLVPLNHVVFTQIPPWRDVRHWRVTFWSSFVVIVEDATSRSIMRKWNKKTSCHVSFGWLHSCDSFFSVTRGGGGKNKQRKEVKSPTLSIPSPSLLLLPSPSLTLSPEVFVTSLVPLNGNVQTLNWRVFSLFFVMKHQREIAICSRIF